MAQVERGQGWTANKKRAARSLGLQRQVVKAGLRHFFPGA
jgi:hypothetical protein